RLPRWRAPLTSAVMERTDFHAKTSIHAGRGQCSGKLTGPLQGLVQVVRLDHHQSSDVLLGFGVRAVGHHDFTVVAADDGCSIGWMQSAVEYEELLGFQLVEQRADFLHHRRKDFGWRRRTVRLV